jgi:tape measure domain-containing protein
MAATDLERLVVQLSADIKKYENSLSRAQGITNQRARAIETRFAKMNKSISSGAAGAAVGLGKAFAVIGGVQGFKSLSDAATSVDNSLKVAGLSGAELEGVYQSLFAAATKNAAPVESLVGLYSKLALVQKELGVSSEQIVGFSGNVALALRVGGTSAEAASGALLGLTQALGNGKVTAEDFGQVLEGAPTILLAAAAGIKEAGGSVAMLRQLMLAGDLSSKAFFDGFQAGTPVLEQKVAGAVYTIDQRLTNLRTSLVNAAREFNSSAKAGETFGSAIDQVAAFVNSVNFESLIGQIQAIITQMNSGIATVNSFAQAIGRLGGYEYLGKGLVDMLPGDGASKSFLGGGLTVTSTAGITDRINQAFEGEIEKAGALTSEAVKNSVLGSGPATTPKAGRVPAAPTVKPISLSDPRYAVPATPKKGGNGGGGGKKSADDYARETEQIKQRTVALQAETDAQTGLNPLMNDYGYAVEFARAKQDLLNAAQEAGKKVTPELAAQIDGLAAGYANAVVASEKLAESQDRIREKAEEMQDFQKDVTRGVVDGLLKGEKAADLFADALGKIGDKLLDMAFDDLFNPKSQGGLGFDLFGAIGGLFRAKGGPVKKGQPYIVGEKRPELFVPDQSGKIIPKLPSAHSMPSVAQVAGSRSAAGPTFTFAPSYNVQGSGPEIADLRAQMARDKADFSAKVVQTVQRAKKTRDL